MLNKSLTTNLVALAIICASYLSPKYNEIIYQTGLFALSGGITNWLAIHMLFEKVPFFYGSGVIPSRFEEFKLGIKQLVMTEFFTPKNIDVFIEQQTQALSTDISKMIDFERVFDGLVEAIESSSMGSMLAMLGGRKALQPLKEPITVKLQEIIVDLQSASNISVILCDHQARDLLACVDTAAIIHNGKVVAQGTPSNLIQNVDAKNAYFGDSFKIS